MPAPPEFGISSGGVPVLDLGQRGGARNTASDALFSVRVLVGRDEPAAVEHKLPQSNVVYRDNLGSDGATHRWAGTIFAKDGATMNAIIVEMNERLHGGLIKPNPSLIKPTKLTDSDGNVLGEKAVLSEWRQTSRRRKGSTWGAIMDVELTFRVLA